MPDHVAYSAGDQVELQLHPGMLRPNHGAQALEQRLDPVMQRQAPPPLLQAVAGDFPVRAAPRQLNHFRSEEHTSELQSLMRISYAVFCLKKKKIQTTYNQ